MREKAEAKKKAAAEGGQMPLGRRQTMAKVIAKEEKRITDSQVAGTSLTFAE